LQRTSLIVRAKKKTLIFFIDRKGFSLVELVTVIAVVGIISAISIPPLSSTRTKYKMRSDARTIITLFKAAQVEAVKRNSNVAILFNTPKQGSCTAFLDNGAGAGGNAGNEVLDGSEQILFIKSLGDGDEFSDISFGSNPSFNSRGFPNVAGSIEIASSGNSQMLFKISLSHAGFVRSKMSMDGGNTWN